jgi:glycopeptide antibiotics resistance protein
VTSQELDSPARARALPRSLTVITAVLGTLYTAAILYATLRPLPWATDGNETPGGVLNPAAWTDLSEWVSGRPGEVLFNVFMFLPVGIAAGLLFRGWVRVAIPIVLTFGIEILQIPLDDRISHPRDLVANTLGGLLGIAVAAAIRRSRTRDRR